MTGTKKRTINNPRICVRIPSGAPNSQRCTSCGGNFAFIAENYAIRDKESGRRSKQCNDCTFVKEHAPRGIFHGETGEPLMRAIYELHPNGVDRIKKLVQYA